MNRTATAPARAQPQTALANIDDAVIEKIESTVRELSLDKLDSMSTMRRTLALAQGMRELRAAFDGPVLDSILALRETKLGFRTDRVPGSEQEQKNGAYSRSTLRDALIEGALRGANFVGNEINVIAGSCYLTKEYFQRKLIELPDLTDLQIVEGVPQVMDKGALVPMWATWKWQSRADEIRCEKIKTEAGEKDTRICVRVNAGMGVDAIIGKAHRKLYARIVARVTGAKWCEVEAVNDEDVIDAEVESEPSQSNGAENHVASPTAWKEMPGLSGELFTDLMAAVTDEAVDKVFDNHFAAAKGNPEKEAIVQTACDGRKAELRANREKGEEAKGGKKTQGSLVE